MLSRSSASPFTAFATLDALVETLLANARQAAAQAEVPVASIIFTPSDCAANANIDEFIILSQSNNAICHKHDPTAHSEMEALRLACLRQQNERLPDCALLTTLEPCLMCSAAISLARINTVYYLSNAHKGLGLNWLLTQKTTYPQCLNHYPKVIQLTKYTQSYQRILQSFFQHKR